MLKQKAFPLFQNINTCALLKTHITGVIDHGQNKFTTYVDIGQYRHDPNLTLNILMKKLLDLAKLIIFFLNYTGDECFLFKTNVCGKMYKFSYFTNALTQ